MTFCTDWCIPRLLSHAGLSSVIGLSNLVTQPVSYKAPSLFPFLKKYIQSTLDFPVCQCSLRWLPALSADHESCHCWTLLRLLLQLQQPAKDRRELSHPPQWDHFFLCSLHNDKLCSPASGFVIMLQKTGKPVSYFPEWKEHFKNSISVVNESFIWVTPFSKGVLPLSHISGMSSVRQMAMTEALVLGLEMMQGEFKRNFKITGKELWGQTEGMGNTNEETSRIGEAIGANHGEAGGSKISNLKEVRGVWRPLLPSANISYII